MATQQFVPFGSVSRRSLLLGPGQSQTVTVSATTPSSPGDAAGSIVLTSDFGFGGTTSIPVTLRSLVDVAPRRRLQRRADRRQRPRRPVRDSQQYYEFNVGPGVTNITANVTLTNDAADPVGAYLVSPDGDTLGYGQNIAERHQRDCR